MSLASTPAPCDRDVPHRPQTAETLAKLASPAGGGAGGGEAPGIEAPRPGEEEDAREVEWLGDQQDPRGGVPLREMVDRIDRSRGHPIEKERFARDVRGDEERRERLDFIAALGLA